MSEIVGTRVVHTTEVLAYRCDRCGARLDAYDVIFVTISVHEDEEGGKVDRFDYCDPCLIAVAPSLIAAGSTAPILAVPPGDSQDGAPAR